MKTFIIKKAGLTFSVEATSRAAANTRVRNAFNEFKKVIQNPIKNIKP